MNPLNIQSLIVTVLRLPAVVHARNALPAAVLAIQVHIRWENALLIAIAPRTRLRALIRTRRPLRVLLVRTRRLGVPLRLEVPRKVAPLRTRRLGDPRLRDPRLRVRALETRNSMRSS